MEQKLLQIIDANLNRAREGLRVCEDIARFTLTDKDVTISLKSARHAVTKVFSNSKKRFLRQLVLSRDTKGDLLKYVDFKKGKGTKITSIFMANIERVKESLRVLEECCKVLDERASRKYRKLRFNVYDIEKKIVEKIRNISYNR